MGVQAGDSVRPASESIRFASLLQSRIFALVVCLAVFPAATPAARAADVLGPVAVAGHGPERPMIEDLARAFEKKHPGAYVDIIWHHNLKPLQLIRSGEADIAVTGKPEPDLVAHQVAWDGIAIMVDLMNKVKSVTKSQVADIFSGKIKFWSELGGPDTRVKIINRHFTQNLTYSFEQSLGIEGKIPESAEVIGPEQKATNKVVGTLAPYGAVTYMSLSPALAAVKTGVAVRLLPIDNVEPESPTVKDGRYTLRRPVLLLTRKDPSATTKAFIEFALSPEGQRLIDRSYTSLDLNHSR